MNNLTEQTIKQIEKQFKEIASSREYCMDVLKKIKEEFNICITNNKADLFKIVELYKDPFFYNTAESRRIYIIINIVKRELLLSTTSSFLMDVHDINEAIDKYILVTLALRRINLQISEGLVKQAKEYLISLKLTPSAIMEIINQELFEGIDWLLNEILSLMSPYWNLYEQIQFSVFMTELFPNEYNCIMTASLYMEANEFLLAREYLEKISNPSNEVINLISALKGDKSE